MISVQVTPAGASSITMTPGTVTTTAGTAFNVTVTAKDLLSEGAEVARDAEGESLLRAALIEIVDGRHRRAAEGDRAADHRCEAVG